MHDGKGAIRTAHALQQRGDVFEIELGRRGLRGSGKFAAQRQKITNGAVVIHCQARRSSKVLEMKLLRSLRCTTASRNPCSSKNSERWKPSGNFWRMVCSMT